LCHRVMLRMRCSLLFARYCQQAKGSLRVCFGFCCGEIALNFFSYYFGSSPYQSRVVSEYILFYLHIPYLILLRKQSFQGYGISYHCNATTHFRTSSNDAKPFTLYRSSKGLSLQFHLNAQKLMTCGLTVVLLRHLLLSRFIMGC
jgi:hypothetical protein